MFWKLVSSSNITRMQVVLFIGIKHAKSAIWSLKDNTVHCVQGHVHCMFFRCFISHLFMCTGALNFDLMADHKSL